ncbi:response regulator [Microvirga arsenatis]|uniref:Response regulator n=1 Tax=Microvirga arsenatis TaxID=2692265 RepID=A0ABW9Z1F0_9HYPH|nr:response regulator [Microvirga arsenatis]NBJ11267.1 response regulator [Microvirga arsenatis]NBJ25540.1 response regulator [Microvirga arsenatis]
MPDQRSTLSERLRVLIVEDETLVADYIADVVEEAGHEVAGFAATGEKALEALARDRVDLAILDIKLKGSMTGIDVAHAARDRAIPYLFISGSGEALTRQAAEATGPLAFLQKPFNQEELVSVLRTTAEREATSARAFAPDAKGQEG